FRPGDLMKDRPRLVVAANHPAVAASLPRRLADEAGDRPEAEIVTSQPALRARLRDMRPAPLLLLDRGLQGLEPGGGMAQMRVQAPGLRIVALARTEDGAEELGLLRSGADAALPWSASPALVSRVLGIVASGTGYLSAAARLAAAAAARTSAVAAPAVPRDPPRPIEPLTERERDILAHIRRGESNRRIGDALGIDENRVKIHLRAIFRKTGARNRTEAALRAAPRSPQVAATAREAPAGAA
ncbi:MAG: response regulator transcription factor, partial [Alphaproteobacteria bacterium]